MTSIRKGQDRPGESQQRVDACRTRYLKRPTTTRASKEAPLARVAAFPKARDGGQPGEGRHHAQAQSFSNSTSRAVNTPPLTVPFTCAIRPTALAKKSSALVPSKSVPAVV